MALSGTLETFSLPDVLRLLSSTKKTGLLALDGDRGTGRVWVEDGDIVAAEADRSVVGDVDAVLFELLRFDHAAFEFDAGAAAPAPGEQRAVEAALDLAQERMEEWREIESVVPSLDVRVRMVPELDAAVEVDPTMWRILARVGTGASGHDVAGHVGQGEFDVCRSLRELVESGLVEVCEVTEPGGAPAAHEPLAIADAFDAMVHAAIPQAAPDVDELEDDAADRGEYGTRYPSDDPEPESAADDLDEASLAAAANPADELAAIFGSPSPSEPAPAADVDLLSGLAHLSPKAAAAVEATWAADAADAADETDETDGVAPPPAAEGDDLDQNLLLRFLSSAKH